MTRYPLRLVLCATAICAYSTSCRANVTCEIDENKKRAIYKTMCGQSAPESQYRFTGPNCFANSVRKRLDDTAIQIHVFRLCGEREFSERLKEANLKAISFMETLSICTPERVDLKKLMEDALSAVAQRVSGASCTSDIKAKLNERRPYFERMIAISNDPSFILSIFGKLGIRVDNAGNIHEK